VSTDQTPLEKICDTADALESDPDRHILTNLNTSLTDAIRAVSRTGRAATVTLKIAIKPAGERRVACVPTVDAKIPRPATSAAQLFADGMGNLHSADPAQGRLHLTTRSPKPEEN
jgi:hypothetical protein